MPDAAAIRLCQIDDLRRAGAKGVVVVDGSSGAALRVLLVADGRAVRAYRNSCPHRGTPLETFPDEFLDRETGLLVCSTHGARFRLEDGLCVAGPCTGARLEPLEVAVSGGEVLLCPPAPPRSGSAGPPAAATT